MYKTACSSILLAQRYKKRIKHTNYIQNPGIQRALFVMIWKVSG